MSGRPAPQAEGAPGKRGGHSRLTFAGHVAERSARGFLDDGCTQIAGSIAFRVVFSLFPLAIVLTALSGIVLQTTGTRGDVVDAIVARLPLSEGGRQEMQALLEGATSSLGGLGLLGLVPLVWAAAGMMGAVRFGLNRAWDVDDPRPYLQGKALDLLFIGVAFVLFVASLMLSIGSSVVERHASSLLGDAGLDPSLVTWVGGRFAPLALAFLAVAAAYRLLPAASPRFTDVVIGALGVGLTWVVLQSAFAFYLSHVNDFNAVYGSLAAVVAFLYFVYLSAVIFLLGAEVVAEMPRVRRALAEAGPDGEGEDQPFGRQVWDAVRGLAVRDAATQPTRRDAASHGDAPSEVPSGAHERRPVGRGGGR